MTMGMLEVREAPISRRGALGRAATLSATALVAGSLPMCAGATESRDRSPAIYEGKYAIDSHKIVDGYFARPRGRTGFDVLVVIPGRGGIDDGVRDLVRRQALAGKLVIAPDLGRTAGTRFASRDAMIADLLAYIPRLRNHAGGSGKVTVVAV